MSLEIVILAAGQGTRMRSALPKVLHPIAGNSMLGHVIHSARQLDPQRIHVVIGHGADVVRERLAADDLNFVLQDKQLGTGHATAQAVPFIDADTVLILYGDVPLIEVETLQRLLKHVVPGQMGLLTVELDDPTGYGRIVRDADGKVAAIVEHKDASEAQRAITEGNTGILAVPANRLADWMSRLSNNNAQGEYYLTDVIGLAVRDGVRINSARPRRSFEVEGVNSKTQLARLEGIWQDHLAEQLTESGVTVLDPSRLDIRGKLQCGVDVVIDVGCVFEGDVKLGDNVYVGPYCVIRNAEIAAGTRIEAFTHIDSAKVGPDAKIGPYSRLRPGAELSAKVHIGNFVEIKKSEIGEGSKVNHLSYIGDTTMGSGVNIGAGTITCNYNGVEKFRTVIGDNAFIGSGTELVAPVTVGSGATIGAGTTLTHNAPEQKLTVGRARQTTIEGWKPPVPEGYTFVKN